MNKEKDKRQVEDKLTQVEVDFDTHKIEDLNEAVFAVDHVRLHDLRSYHVDIMDLNLDMLGSNVSRILAESQICTDVADTNRVAVVFSQIFTLEVMDVEEVAMDSVLVDALVDTQPEATIIIIPHSNITLRLKMRRSMSSLKKQKQQMKMRRRITSIIIPP